jgi:hypothetical protein
MTSREWRFVCGEGTEDCAMWFQTQDLLTSKQMTQLLVLFLRIAEILSLIVPNSTEEFMHGID